MEYPVNKKNPVLLLKLAQLYIEYAAYRGALSVCTLLVEGYTHFKQINEAIFLSAVTAKALGKHRESAQYFQYLVEKPPHRLSAYHLHLLAAREFEKVPGMQDHMRESCTQAYKAMIALAPVMASEKNAHEIYKKSRKNENLRIQLWYQDDMLWFDLAKKMSALNSPLLVVSALDVLRQRNASMPIEMLILEGVAFHRTGNAEAAESSLVQAIQHDYYSKLVRFLLQSWSENWRQQFILEIESATRIQRLTRSYFRRKRWRQVMQLLIEANRNDMACVIQCAWRRFVAQCKLFRLKEERRQREKSENAAMAAQDMFVIMKRLNAAAVKIQSLHKIFLAKRKRKIRDALRERHTIILSNFAMHRAAMGRKHVLKTWTLFVELQKQERICAASRIQRCARAYISRKVYKRLLKKKQNQERIIDLCIGKKSTSLRRFVFKEWKAAADGARRAKVAAAIRIQHFYRACVARRKYRAALRRHKITLELMNRMLFDRSHRLMLRSWTMLSSNAVRHRMQKRSSAILIQKRVRGMRGRKIAKNARARRRRVEAVVRAMQTKSAKQMLALVFRSLQQNVELNFEERDNCAITIQRLFRGFRTRKCVRTIRECEEMLSSPDLTLKAQPRAFVLRLCFLIIARFPEQEANERKQSASRIQRSWRLCCRRRRLRVALAKLMKRKAILMRLQTTFKTLAKVFFYEIKKLIQARKWRQNRAARKIQRAMRLWLTRRRYVCVVEKKAESHLRAQQLAHQKRNSWLLRVLKAWRTALVSEQQQNHEAARTIQRMYRTKLAQRQASKVVAKKAAQARLLASVSQKPLERCFRKWESLLIEKCTLSVRSALKSPMHFDDKRRLASKAESKSFANPRDSRTLEQVHQHNSVLPKILTNLNPMPPI